MIETADQYSKRRTNCVNLKVGFSGCKSSTPAGKGFDESGSAQADCPVA